MYKKMFKWKGIAKKIFTLRPTLPCHLISILFFNVAFFIFLEKMWQPNIDRISSNYKPLQPIVTWNDRKIDTQGCVLAKVIDTTSSSYCKIII